jgi:hypothetical protein
MARADEEIAKAKQRALLRREQAGKPFRFFVPIGETRRVVVVDEKPDFFMYEHCEQGPDGIWNVYSGCVKETDICAKCEALKKESYYALFLTVIDLTPYENKKGETVEFSRKLFVVKNQQQKKFMRWAEKEGSLRGAILDCTRDGDKEPRIGNDIEIVEYMDEAELAQYIRDWTDKKGKQQEEDCSVPYDYEKLFTAPDAAQLRASVGARPVPGSREADARELNQPAPRRGARDGWEKGDTEQTYEGAEEAPARRAPVSRRAAAPAGGNGTRRAAPVRTATAPARVSRSRVAPQEAPEEVQAVGWTEDDLQADEYLDDDGNIVNEAGDILAPANEAPEVVAPKAPVKPVRPVARTAVPARRGPVPVERAAVTRRPVAGRRAPVADDGDDIPFDPPASEESETPQRRVTFRGRA